MTQTAFAGPSVPSNDGYAHIIDSTRGFAGTPANAATLVATGGDHRGRWAGARLEFSIQVTGQNATLVRQIWNGSAFETVANTSEINGSQTLTAGTTYPVRWVPPTPDWRMYLLAGSTAPTTVVFSGMLILGDRAAVS